MYDTKKTTLIQTIYDAINTQIETNAILAHRFILSSIQLMLHVNRSQLYKFSRQMGFYTITT